MHIKTHAGLCAGYGGFEFAAAAMGWETKFWVEPDAFCQQILKYYYPQADGYDYIQNHNYEKYKGTIDVLTAGFPCQPASTAGKRKGAEDNRFIWPAVMQAIIECGPGIAVLENVAGLLSILEPEGLSKVENKAYELFGKGNKTKKVIKSVESVERRIIGRIITDLEAAGYTLPKLQDGTPIILCIPACSVNAPHRRDRIWLVAYRKGYRSCGESRTGDGQTQSKERQTIQQHITGFGGFRLTTNTTSQGRKGRQRYSGSTDATQTGKELDCQPQRLGKKRPAANTHSNGHQPGRPGKNRQAQGEGAGQQNKWERLWCHFGRTGQQGPVTYTAVSGRFQTDRAGITGQPDQTGTDNDGQAITGNSNKKRRKGSKVQGEGERQQTAGSTNIAGSYITDWANWPTEPPVCTGDDGIPEHLYAATIFKSATNKNGSITQAGWRNETIKAAGNAIVPQVAITIFQAIERLEKMT